MSQLYILEKPDISIFDQKEILDLILQEKNQKYFQQIFFNTSYPIYLCWDAIKYKNFSSEFPLEKIWAAIKIFRRLNYSPTIIKAENNNFFNLFQWYPRLSGIEEFLHQMDLNTGGHLSLRSYDLDEKSKMKFISRGIVEEAIASSQLEGASTTRKLAKKFLAEGRKPKTTAEHMILNNYNSMKVIEEDFKNKSLTLDLFFELHSMVIKNTVPKSELFRFRKDDDNIVIEDVLGQFTYHVPPKIAIVEKEIGRLLEFANDTLEELFIHPIIKAIMLHFWVGYLHPFTDGNGRLARLIFYWYLLRKGYWAFSYLPISTIIRKSPAQYAKAYIYSEQDDFDLTYFIDYNIGKIKLAMADFERYMEKISQRNKQMNIKAKTAYDLNDRQIQLLQYYHENNDEYTTPTMHMNHYQISKITAIRDLQYLLRQGFVFVKKDKKKSCYLATDKINDLFKK